MKMNPTQIVFALLVGLVLFASGCSQGDRPELAPVSGTITLDGKPLKNATVIFKPATGKASRAFTDQQGHYELAYLRDIMGAKLGQHIVGITTTNMEAGIPELVPVRYNKETELSAEVKPGNNEFDFSLKTKE